MNYVFNYNKDKCKSLQNMVGSDKKCALSE